MASSEALSWLTSLSLDDLVNLLTAPDTDSLDTKHSSAQATRENLARKLASEAASRVQKALVARSPSLGETAVLPVFARLGSAVCVLIAQFLDQLSLCRCARTCRYFRVLLSLSLSDTPTPGLFALKRSCREAALHQANSCCDWWCARSIWK